MVLRASRTIGGGGYWMAAAGQSYSWGIWKLLAFKQEPHYRTFIHPLSIAIYLPVTQLNLASQAMACYLTGQYGNKQSIYLKNRKTAGNNS